MDSPRSGSETGLVWLLRISGALMVLALPAACMPLAWMDRIHQGLLATPLPSGPIVEYLARSASLIYGLNGVGTLLIATDVRRYGPLVRLWGWAHAAGGLALAVVDSSAGLPPLWIAAEGPPLIVIGAVALWLERRVRLRTAGVVPSR